MSTKTVSQILREEFATILQEQNQSWQDGQYNYTLQSDGSIQYTSPETGRLVTVTAQSNERAYNAIMATKPGGAAPAQAQGEGQAPGQTHDADDLADAQDIAKQLDRAMSRVKALVPVALIADSELYEKLAKEKEEMGEKPGVVAQTVAGGLKKLGDLATSLVSESSNPRPVDLYMIQKHSADLIMLEGKMGDITQNMLGKFAARSREAAEKFMKEKGEDVSSSMDLVDKLIRRYLSKPERARALAGAYYTFQNEAGKSGWHLSIVGELESLAAVVDAIPSDQFSKLGLDAGLGQKLKDAARFIYDASSDQVDPASNTSEKAFQGSMAEQALSEIGEWVSNAVSETEAEIKEKEGAIEKKKEAHKKMYDDVKSAAQQFGGDIADAVSERAGPDGFDEDDMKRAMRKYARAVRASGAKEGQTFYKAITGASKNMDAQDLLDFYIDQGLRGYDSWRDIYKADDGDSTIKAAHDIYRDL